MTLCRYDTKFDVSDSWWSLTQIIILLLAIFDKIHWNQTILLRQLQSLSLYFCSHNIFFLKILSNLPLKLYRLLSSPQIPIFFTKFKPLIHQKALLYLKPITWPILLGLPLQATLCTLMLTIHNLTSNFTSPASTHRDPSHPTLGDLLLFSGDISRNISLG